MHHSEKERKMSKDDITRKIKKFRLSLKRIRYNIFKFGKVNKFISYSVLLLSAILFMGVVSLSFVQRVPILSFFSDQLQFPHKYELSGKVEISDNTDKIMLPIEVKIGGFNINSYSDNFYTIHFVASQSNRIPVVIMFEYKGKEYERVEYITYESDYSLNQVFAYDLGD